MPSGIILSSGSVGATKESIEKVLSDNGYEADKPEPEAGKEPEEKPAKPAEPEEKPDEREPGEEEDQPKTAKPSRRQRAVEKATKELKEELRQTKERLAALEGKKPDAEKAADPIPPKRDDFKSDAEYEDALFDYRYRTRRAKEQAEEARRTQEQALQKNFKDYQAQVEQFSDEHDDWDEVVNQSIPIPEAVYYAIVDLGKEGPPVTYYLGQHPEEIDRLAELTPYRAAIEVGRLADKLAKGTKPNSGAEATKPKPKAKIPEPVEPVSTSATTASLSSADAAKRRDYRAFKAAQRAGR